MSTRNRLARLLLVAGALVTLTACPSTTVDGVTRVTVVSPTSATLQVGETITLQAVVGVVGNAVKSVTWSSSDPSVATIGADSGVVTALAPGAVEMKATSKADSSKSDAVTLTVVVADGVISVGIDAPVSTTLGIGETLTLTATVETTGDAAKTVTWRSSNEAVASIDEDTGELVTHEAGVTDVSATSTFDTTMSDTITITVTVDDGVTSVRIDEPATTTLEMGAEITLTATVSTTGDAPQTVTWESSDPAVASIDGDTGELTANALGTTDITATSTFDTTMSDTITITVSGVLGVQIDTPASTTLDVGQTVTLTATVDVIGDSSQTVDWTSSDSAVASVDEDGLLTGSSPGIATITATSTEDPTKSDSVEITVSGVVNVRIDTPTSTTLDVGQTITLGATVETYGTAPNTVTWTSSNPGTASVGSASGVLTPIAAGTTTITATSTSDPTKTDSIEITVSGVLEVQIDAPTSDTITVGDTLQLTTSVQVIGDAPQTVTWSSSHSDVATVSSSGIVTATLPGVAEITATSTADPTKTDAILITVTGWTDQLGTLDVDQATAVAVDSAGNAYVVGFTDGLLFGPAPYGLTDAFIIKYLPNGTTDWAQQFGTPRNERALAVAVDSSGDIVVAGEAAGDLDTGTNLGHFAIFVRKYTGSGSVLWTRQFSTGQNGTAFGVTTDSSGNIVVVGRTRGDLQGTGAGLDDVFARMYDSTGNVVWTQQFGTVENDEAIGVAVAGGAVYLAGTTDGNLATTNVGGTDVFLAQLDASNGSRGWTVQIGTTNGDYNHGVTVGPDGKVVIAGNTYGYLDPAGSGAGDAYLAKYEPADGSLIWLHQFGTLAIDVGYGVTTDSLGNIYLAGSTRGDLAEDNQGESDAFVRKFDPGGSQLATTQFGSTGADTLTGIAVDAHGNVVVSGYTLGDLVGPNAGGADAFVSKLGM